MYKRQSVDSSAVYCWAHPLTGGKQIVAESWRNLISVGATPIAITNCLNFGSPEKEDIKHLKIIDVLKKILANPNVCSKQWIWEQYDHTVMGDTIQKPGGDAGVVRVHGTDKAVAASVDSSAVYCWAHPLTGGKQVVCESFRNLISCLLYTSPSPRDCQ